MNCLEIIDKLTKIYIKSPKKRATGEVKLSNGTIHKYSAYRIIDGEKEKRCIVGLCLRTGEWLEFEGNIQDIFKHICNENAKKFNLLFLPKYKGHSVDFWMDIQKFHDEEEFWDKKSLTESGKEYLNKLREKYLDK